MLHSLKEFAALFPLASFWFWIDVCAVIGIIFLARRLADYKWLFVVFVLPGTVLHELAHWLLAKLFFGKPSAPSLWPRTQKNRWILGHVTIRNPRWYNMLPIGLAPLLLLPLAYFAYFYGLRHYRALQWQHWIGLYLVATALQSALPSREDWLLVWRYALPLLLGVTIGAGAIYLASTYFGAAYFGVAHFNNAR